VRGVGLQGLHCIWLTLESILFIEMQKSTFPFMGIHTCGVPGILWSGLFENAGFNTIKDNIKQEPPFRKLGIF